MSQCVRPEKEKAGDREPTLGKLWTGRRRDLEKSGVLSGRMAVNHV